MSSELENLYSRVTTNHFDGRIASMTGSVMAGGGASVLDWFQT
jgi:hypothetical protein